MTTIEDVRDKLDTALDAKDIRHATARNAWSILTGALKAAYSARDRTLRRHSMPIHFGILPPKRGAGRQRPWLYPNEWEKFVRHAEIPMYWKHVCAIALYTGLRPGELRALLWSDVDIEARTISVSKAYDTSTKLAKAPKTISGQRIIPLHAHLAPLLKALRGQPGDEVIGFVAFSDRHSAPDFRAALEIAEIRRPRLTADNATEEPIDFRSLRDTHATWLALEGVSDKVIQRRMGHASPTTTDRYVKAAETFAVDNVGVPFPPLPENLLVRSAMGHDWAIAENTPRKHREN